MRTISLMFIFLLLFISCKDNSTQEEAVGLGRLFTINHGTYRTRLASDDWNTMNYGFDAVPDLIDAYASLETGNKNNTFLLIGAPNLIDIYSVKADDNYVTLIRSGNFTIPDPTNPPNNISAVRYTVNSNTFIGSEKLKVYKYIGLPDGTSKDVDLEELVKVDEAYWKKTTPSEDAKNPITLELKVYTKTTLPVAYVYKLYGTTGDISNSKEYFNKILSQAACDIQDINLVDEWPNADRSWDKNGNGQLDISSDATYPNEELAALKVWAGSANIWNENRIGVVILEKDFLSHNTDGTTIKGVKSGKFIVLPATINNRTFCHEYLHICGVTDIIDDEYNIEYMTDDYEGLRLRYREFTQLMGGKISQWKQLSKQNF